MHVVILTLSLGFPHGMAATQRIRMMAQALVKQGVRTTVLCSRTGEDPARSQNREIRGHVNGVAFEYSTGTPFRPRSFLARRWVDLRGWVVAVYRLIRWKRRGELDAVYLWTTIQSLTPARVGYTLLLNALGVPVVVEVNERPWSLKPRPSFWERHTSPLFGVSGALVISPFLKGWLLGEDRRRRVRCLEVPILVDTAEGTAPGPHEVRNEVLFAGDPRYEETIRFILSAMETAWARLPGLKLVITGCSPGEPASAWLVEELSRRGLDAARVELAGFLPRSELLGRYRQARALLIPLFDDVRSQARFPTKIGEYLASGTPVVSSRVGAVACHLAHGETAFLCAPGDAVAFGLGIVEAVSSPQAAAIGAAGRALAETRFRYTQQGPALAAFFRDCARRVRPDATGREPAELLRETDKP